MDRSSLGWEGECSRPRNHKCKGPEVNKRQSKERGSLRPAEIKGPQGQAMQTLVVLGRESAFSPRRV